MCLFLYWLPVLVCLLGARFRDIYQLVPILLQLIFLLSPILYKRKNLGSMAWTADFNPIYHILSQVRDTLMLGQVQWATGLVLLLFNLVGIWVALKLLNRERPNLPFLI
jgi:lipopolysaccharide transport system permease protein